MTWRVEEMDASGAHILADVFNRHIREVPHEPGVMPGPLSEAFQRTDARLEDECILVATDGPQVLGYLHGGVIVEDDGSGKAGLIRFLGFPREDRGVGQVLLNTMESRFREKGVLKVRAFDYRYGNLLCWYAHLKSPWEHIDALLRANGYLSKEIPGRIMFLDVIDPEAPDVDGLGVDLTVEEEDGYADLPGILVQAWRDGQWVGACRKKAYLLPAWDSPPRDICYTAGMGVDESVRGQGLGRLLMAASLHEMSKRGCRRAILDVDGDNHVALMLYSSMGYRTCYFVSGVVSRAVCRVDSRVV